MGFESVNELEQFNFDDCVIADFQIQPGGLHLEVDALIVRPRNSQNTNFTESYADTAVVRLKDGKIESAVKEGYKYYDANGTLLEEEPDQTLAALEIDEFLRKCKGAYWFRMDKDSVDDGRYSYYMEIEVPGDDPHDTCRDDAYEVKVSFTQAVVSWERYLNRVEQ